MMICNSTCLRTPSDRKTNSKVPSTMDSFLQRKAEVRVSRSNEQEILVGSRVLGRGPSVGMIASQVLDLMKVRASDNFIVFSRGPVTDTTSASRSCDLS